MYSIDGRRSNHGTAIIACGQQSSTVDERWPRCRLAAVDLPQRNFAKSKVWYKEVYLFLETPIDHVLWPISLYRLRIVTSGASFHAQIVVSNQSINSSCFHNSLPRITYSRKLVWNRLRKCCPTHNQSSWAMIMTNAHTKVQGPRSVTSEDRVKTNGRTEERIDGSSGNMRRLGHLSENAYQSMK